jgi:hypothetical protein
MYLPEGWCLRLNELNDRTIVFVVDLFFVKSYVLRDNYLNTFPMEFRFKNVSPDPQGFLALTSINGIIRYLSEVMVIPRLKF